MNAKIKVLSIIHLLGIRAVVVRSRVIRDEDQLCVFVVTLYIYGHELLIEHIVHRVHERWSNTHETLTKILRKTLLLVTVSQHMSQGA